MFGSTMNTTQLLCTILGLSITTAVPIAHAASSPVAVTNSGFESRSQDGLLEGWTLTQAPAKGTHTGRDHRVRRSGKASLRIQNTTRQSATWRSEPVTLRVGHLYRLSGWIKTDRAFADPTSQYPTAVPACLTMASFPFTNHSMAVGATKPWIKVETLFIATQTRDRVRVHLGFNGWATGTAWFDDLTLEKVESIDGFLPAEGVTRYGPAYRYDDRGWIFVHIEGRPYERGYQYGRLLSEEIAAYAQKLAHQRNLTDPKAGWDTVRFMTQAWLLNRYEDEFVTEMKGIADGARSTGQKLFEREIDLVDIACLNSVIDLGQMQSALQRTPNATSGLNFLKTEDELKVRYENHKCSAFAATRSATADQRFVFGQIFMWYGYTGVHWNVITDLQPSQGHRFVYHTFPGGIHSGADFYISQSGLVIGETTVRQTPFNQDGTPQSNRIRKAIQYANTIEELVAIMTERNNGQYTNEWPFANYKTDEIGIFLLGTEKHRLWRSTEREFPGGLTDFYWCNNNNKDLEVRKEYVVDQRNAPYDLAFRPWNRDIAFNRFYRKHKGSIDATAGVNLWASSPINRAHACDGKITTGEMAEQLVFLAHHGKTTLREKLPGTRLIKDRPGAQPHLSLGYAVPSPLFITDKIARRKSPTSEDQPVSDPEMNLEPVEEIYTIDKRKLWRNTVYPASLQENWLVSGSAAYWRMLDELPEEASKAVKYLDAKLAELNDAFLFHVAREGDVAPLRIAERYDRYIDYQIPRIKGTIALHQLRLLLGNAAFFEALDQVYSRYRQRPVTTKQFIKALEKSTGRSLGDFFDQWLGQKGLPRLETRISSRRAGKRWRVSLVARQPEGTPYHLFGTLTIETTKRHYRHPVELKGRTNTLKFIVDEKPTEISFNRGRDFPVRHDKYYGLGHFFEDFDQTLIVYGTTRQIEAHHAIARRWQLTLANTYAEILSPLRKDAELSAGELSDRDLMVLGTAADNSVMALLAEKIPELTFKKNLFYFRGTLYPRADQGMILVLPNPYNKRRKIFLIIANSARQLYHMTGKWHRDIHGYALFKGPKIELSGFHPVEQFEWASTSGE